MYARAFVYRHAGLLVDGHHARVLVEHVERNVLGAGVQGRQMAGVDDDEFAAAEGVAGFAGEAVDEDEVLLDPVLNAGARVTGEFIGDELVEAFAG